MKKRLIITVFILLMGLAIPLSAAPTPSPAPATIARAAANPPSAALENFARLPLAFEPN